ncbi:hypothetical protein Dda_2793 [Drechslerella dactyloides]|uniref:AB hydrolase-1 domain-containing protein n=1 Tax=Drechslerella dactyloides TaxID=74499 RepID=A0AAD6J145_DREDA|nr:hypothetical protein Dda_2793 [Drechslerella dactyloides]
MATDGGMAAGTPGGRSPRVWVVFTILMLGICWMEDQPIQSIRPNCDSPSAGVPRRAKRKGGQAGRQAQHDAERKSVLGCLVLQGSRSNQSPQSIADRLQDLVIDTEYLNGNRAAMIDPSVRVVLLAHSMGGIVAADTLLSILDDEPIKKPAASPSSGPSSPLSKTGSLDPRKNKDDPSSSAKMYDADVADERILFPAIIGICAFDTPYLGLSPSMFANSAENNFRQASDAFTTVSGIAKSLGFFSAQEPAAMATASSGAPAAALPSAEQAASASSGGWGWGKLAMVAGAAATVSTGAAAAMYWNKSNITEGFNWVTSHLEFVGVLFKSDSLKTRVMRASAVSGVGIANFYTMLGKGTKSAATPGGKTVEVGGGGVRTFCSLPPKPRRSSTPASPSSPKGKAATGEPSSPASPTGDKGTAPGIDVGDRDIRAWWHSALNDKAPDEVTAHTYMFKPSTNPGYKDLLDRAGKQVMRWTINWYDAEA